MKIELDAVINFLVQEGFLKGKILIDYKQPGHGPCCTCQTCGYNYDDCVCQHNFLLSGLANLSLKE
jgi:hypothetical protein